MVVYLSCFLREPAFIGSRIKAQSAKLVADEVNLYWPSRFCSITLVNQNFLAAYILSQLFATAVTSSALSLARTENALFY